MNRGEFTRAVLIKLNAPVDGARIQFGVAWAAYENTEALNNPWATTEPWAGATEFNSVGVKNYPTFIAGVDATVQTLLLSYYSHLVSMLRDPNASVRSLLNALDASPWGSHPNTLLFQDVVLEYAKYNIEVPGSGGDTPVPGTVPHRSLLSRILPHALTNVSTIKENVTMDVTTAGAALVAALNAVPLVQADVDTAQANLEAAVLAAQAGVTVGASEAAVDSAEVAAVDEVDTLEARIAAGGGTGASGVTATSTPTPTSTPSPVSTPSGSITLAEAQSAASTVVAFLAQ